MSSLDYLDLCRLCLVKDRVSVPIFEGEGDVRQIFLKIAACLPVKVTREDKLPKKICDDCVYKVELLYQFWNTTANAEKQLLQWLGEVGLEDKQSYVTGVLNPNVMKQEQNGENRLDGNAMQQVNAHQPNMGMGMMDNMGMGMPLMMSTASQQQMTSVPMDTSGNPVQSVQAVPGPSTQTTHDQMAQNQANAPPHQDEEEESSEEEENSDDDCDGDEGLPVKEESEEDPSNSRTLEPTTFVNVSLACDEPGPSGLQQQKIAEMPEMSMPQVADGDPKSGSISPDPLDITSLTVKPDDHRILQPSTLDVVVSRTSETLEEQRSPRMTDEEESYSDKDDVNKFIDKKKLHTCKICQMSFEENYRLTRHMIKHSDSRTYKCMICSKEFKYSQSYACHMKVHKNGLVHACTVCNFRASTTSHLKAHYVRRHTAEYDFSCDECGKMFKTHAQIKTHRKIHDMRSCVCDVCGITCPSKLSLYNHTKYKHTIKVKLFECTICHRRYVTQKNLDNHTELHKNKYRCDHCDKEFSSKNGLVQHMRIHTRAKTYVCTVCDKAFGSLGTQRIHLLTHMGERPYVCDICGRSFTQRSPMIIHRRKHPGKHPPQPNVSIVSLLAAQDKVPVDNKNDV